MSNRLSVDKKKLALRCLLEGTSIRGASRLTGAFDDLFDTLYERA